LALQPTMLDLGSVRAGKRALLASASPADRRILTQLGTDFLNLLDQPCLVDGLNLRLVVVC
jgi:hypothetical protein